MLQPVRKLSLFSGCNKSKSLLSNNIRQNTYFRPIEIDYHMNISISHRNYQNCSSQLFGCKPIEFVRCIHTSKISYSNKESGSRLSSNIDKFISHLNDQLNNNLKTQNSSVNLKNSAMQNKVEDWSEIITRWYQNYLDFVGITSLTQSQEQVKTVSIFLRPANIEIKYFI